ncbi:MAG TPA: Bcr/CflA family multidrug efflux MFS transporter [Dongiaceae bacterium]|nr:Bcr/CflA family multidrug efflux MFS transporter [Dongiaceae bacterium]
MAAESAPGDGQERVEQAARETEAGGHGDAEPLPVKGDGRAIDLQPGFVILLTALTALGPVSTDFYLPSLPNIARYFSVGEAEAQLTLSAFLICFAATMLVFGPLSDRFGRKPVMLGGLTIFTLASAACALASSIDQLIVARMFQAIGAGAGPVISRAVVRDRFGAGGASRVLSYLAAAMTLAPAIGPILGGYLQERFGWQSIFWAISLYGAIAVACAAFRLPESHAPANRTSHGPIAMLRTYAMLLRHKRYVGFVLCQTFSYSGIFCFISGSSFVFINILGVAPAHFGWCFSVFVIGYLIGTVTSTRLTHRIGIDGMVRLGAAVALAATVVLVLIAVLAPSVIGLLAPLMVYMIGIGMASPNSQAGAIGPFPQAAGAASSLLGFLQMSIAAGVGAFLGHLEAQTAWPMALAILLTACGLNLSYWLVVRPGAEGRSA